MVADLSIRLDGHASLLRKVGPGMVARTERRILTKAAISGENWASIASPVDTGRLRASITHAVTPPTAWYGTNVHYGKKLDESKLKAYRYRRGPFKKSRLKGWLTEKSREALAKDLPGIVDDEAKRLEAEWRSRG